MNLYFFEYSPDVLKKKSKVLDIFNTNKKSSPPEIWIRICVLEINGSSSLVFITLLFRPPRETSHANEGKRRPNVKLNKKVIN